MEKAWIDIGALDDIPRLGARVVKTPLGCVAIFRAAEDEVYALDDRCPHKHGPLSQGIVHGRTVTCPLHNWVISLESGRAEGADEGQVKTFAVRVERGRILIDADALLARSG
ncbi:MAG: nitrite reductase small subunit NirD [Hyphomicrobiaceae bacterium]